MQITLAYVISVNGKATEGDNPDVHSWSSQADWEHFSALRDRCDVIILDRKSYEAVRPTPEPDRLRVVFTSTPERFSDKTVPGQLEFTDIPLQKYIEQLFQDGRTHILAAGGARMSTELLAAGLIDDIYVTFEPLLFGTGGQMFSETLPKISLTLKSVRTLNNKGTLLAHYTVDNQVDGT